MARKGFIVVIRALTGVVHNSPDEHLWFFDATLVPLGEKKLRLG
jgi:hypothetical protein